MSLPDSPRLQPLNTVAPDPMKIALYFISSEPWPELASAIWRTAPGCTETSSPPSLAVLLLKMVSTRVAVPEVMYMPPPSTE
jgi:hypothetical protein